jgi:hypothetical protein
MTKSRFAVNPFTINPWWFVESDFDFQTLELELDIKYLAGYFTLTNRSLRISLDSIAAGTMIIGS